MSTLAVQLKIGDYAKWLPVFDKHKALRDKAGFTNVQIYRQADKADEILIWANVADVAKGREALAGRNRKLLCKRRGSSDLRKFM